MQITRRRRGSAVLILVLVLALPLAAAARVHREDWIRRVNFYNYTRILVVPMETANARLPKKDDKSYEAVARVTAEASDHFLEGFKAHLSPNIRNRVTVDATPGKPKGAAVIRTRLLSVDPGSRFKRAWTERGGQTQVIVEGEVLDAANGEVLLRFGYSHESGHAHADDEDERGGSDYPLLVGDLKVIGGFLGDVLKANEWTW